MTEDGLSTMSKHAVTSDYRCAIWGLIQPLPRSRFNKGKTCYSMSGLEERK
jgi:hypothetical protein